LSSVYNNDTGEVLLAKFTSSQQMIADNEGKATSQLEDYWRVKTYVKPVDMLDAAYPIFPQPYQLAAYQLGGDWNEYNGACVIQVAGCNLDCWYCYVDKMLRQGNSQNDEGTEIGKWFTVPQVIDLFRASGKKVWRVSGGEPTLAPKFLADMVYAVFLENALLWIDTNLSGGDEFYDLVSKIDWNIQEGAGICGCFKGFTRGDAAKSTRAGNNLLDLQFTSARRLVEDTSLNAFFYVPGIVTPEVTYKQIKEFFERMVEEVDPMAPLRTHILQINNYSSTKMIEWWSWQTIVEGQCRPIDAWKKLLREYYTPEQLWLPSHQVRFQKRR
jgi:uncharacterized Fe-S cluster-containing radical SAM superfamily protein